MRRKAAYECGRGAASASFFMWFLAARVNECFTVWRRGEHAMFINPFAVIAPWAEAYREWYCAQARLAQELQVIASYAAAHFFREAAKQGMRRLNKETPRHTLH